MGLQRWTFWGAVEHVDVRNHSDRVVIAECKEDAYPFPKEDNIRLHQPSALRTPRDFLLGDTSSHLGAVERCLAVNTALRSETAVGFNDKMIGDARNALEGVDVLRETCLEKRMCSKEPDEAMCWCWAELSWVKLVRQGVD